MTEEKDYTRSRRIVYTYDNAGNITSRKEYTLTGTTPLYNWEYDYDDAWGDLLTSYRGQTIEYDEIGNPTSYFNGSRYTFGWEGRRLVSAVRGASTYDDTGLRTSKAINGVTHHYYWMQSTADKLLSLWR